MSTRSGRKRREGCGPSSGLLGCGRSTAFRASIDRQARKRVSSRCCWLATIARACLHGHEHARRLLGKWLKAKVLAYHFLDRLLNAPSPVRHDVSNGEARCLIWHATGFFKNMCMRPEPILGLGGYADGDLPTGKGWAVPRGPGAPRGRLVSYQHSSCQIAHDSRE